MTVTAFQQANQLLREGKLEAAVVVYRQAIEQNPNSYLSYQNLGETLGKLGHWEEAVAAYRRAVELKPDAAWLSWGLSQALEQLGRIEEAQQLRQRALEIDPKLGQLHFTRGSSVKVVSSSLLKTPVQSDTTSDILQRSQAKIRQFHNKHWGERCVIIGNGPSLNKMDLSFLKHEICFGTNKIYLGFDRWGFSPTYYVAINSFVIEQSVNEIRKLSCPKFIGNRGISYFDAADDIIFVRTFPAPDESFSKRADVGLNEGSTVTYAAMQLAYYMGFSEVVLIGVDHHFVTQGTPHTAIISDGDDPNHFDPRYFGNGLKWQLPDLENSEKSYQVAKQVFEESGRRIIDATVNGRCQVFPKQDYRLVFQKGLSSGFSNDPQVKSINFSNLTIQPEVSIIVPAYNEERFIRDNLESAILQNFENWECIVIDDCSSDTCSQIAEEYCDKDRRFRLIRHHKNSGLSASRNTGIRLARGKYLTFLDADDFFLQNSLSARLSKLKELESKRIDVVGVFCGAEIVREEINNPFWENKSKIRNHLRDFITSEGDAPFSPNAPIVIKCIIEKFGGFDEKLLHGAEDWDMWLRIMRHGYCFEPVEVIAVAYREKQHSMVRSMAGQHLREAQRLYAEANTTLPKDLIVDEQAPYIFWRPRHYYATMLKYIQRAVKFLTMAKLSGDHNAYNKTLSLLPPNSLFYIKRHLNLVDLVNEGVRRFYCLSKDELSGKLDQFKEIKKEIFSDLNIALQQPDPVHSLLSDYAQNYSRPKYSSRLWRERIDIFLIVRNKDEIEALATVVSDLQELGLIGVFIDFDSVLADNGCRDELIKQKLDYVSYSAYNLGEFKPQAVLVSNLARQLSLAEKAVIETAGEKKIKTIGIDLGEKNLNSSTVDLCDIVLLEKKADKSKPSNKDVIVINENLSNSIAAAIMSQLQSRQSLDETKLFATQVIVEARQIDSVNTSEPDYIKLEEHSPYPVDEEELRRFKDIHKGERCFIIGNGPSLNKHDLSLLKNDVSIAVNGIFYKMGETGFSPTYYVVEDDAVMRENIEEIKKIQTKHKFFPSVYRHLHPKDINVSFFRRNRGFYEQNSPNYCIPRFSTDMTQRLYCGQSVTIINLQMAFYMGFTTVYLMGMDFSYVIPPEFKRRGVLITSTGDDPNHFHKDYFGVGKTWKDPKLEMVKRNYELCKMIYDWNDRKIYNATIGGELEVFKRVDYNSLFRYSNPK